MTTNEPRHSDPNAPTGPQCTSGCPGDPAHADCDEHMRTTTRAIDLARCANRLRAAHLHLTAIVCIVPPFARRAAAPLEIIASVIAELDALEQVRR